MKDKFLIGKVYHFITLLIGLELNKILMSIKVAPKNSMEKRIQQFGCVWNWNFCEIKMVLYKECEFFQKNDIWEGSI